MGELEQFRPRWYSAPGDTISDILRERGLSVKDLATLLGCDLETVQNMLQGRATITLHIARRLERAIGGSVEFWMARDFQYREDAAKLTSHEREWLDELPLGDMIRFGWIRPTPHASGELIACLGFLRSRERSGVASPLQRNRSACFVQILADIRQPSRCGGGVAAAVRDRE